MNTKQNTKKTWKIPRLVFGVFLFCIFLLYLQFAYLSLSKKVYGKDMDAFALSRSTVKKNISATRGTIYDANQNILAQNISSYTVIAYLEASKESRKDDYVKDVHATAVALASVLNADEAEIEERLKKKLYQVELGSAGRGITELKKEEIEALDLPGIDFIESEKRYYPNGDFASYTIGYAKDVEVTNSDGSVTNEIKGELGIEGKYNELLKGTDGYLEYQQDRYGYKIAGTKEISEPALDGYNIYLTIDSTIQRFVETAVKDASNKYTPEWLQLTVMDAKTGDILGTSATPSFDPNVRNITSYENPLVTLTFEPGSVMKTYTYMCAIESGKYDGNAVYSSGSVEVGGATVRDWDTAGWGLVTFDKGYEYSSNVGIVNLIKTYLSKKELRECFKKYGFGQTTGIELAGEQTGNIDFNYEVEVATAGFGQGITTTSIQQLQALTIVANNGDMLKPHIVSKIVNPNTNEVYYEREVERTKGVVKKSTADKMKELMYNTVHGTDRGTTARIFNIDGLDIIGKTGTSQIYNASLGGYVIEENENRYIFSFAGMFPKDDPKYIIYAAMKIPSTGKNLGVRDATKSVINSIIKYEDLSDRKDEEENTLIDIDSYTSKNVVSVKNDLESKGLNVVILGDGDSVLDQYPKSGSTLISGDKVILKTNSNYVMPNIIGWSRSDAVALFKLLNIKYEIEGYGFVIGQSVSVLSPISDDTSIKIVLEEKYKSDG